MFQAMRSVERLTEQKLRLEEEIKELKQGEKHVEKHAEEVKVKETPAFAGEKVGETSNAEMSIYDEVDQLQAVIAALVSKAQVRARCGTEYS